MEIYGRAGGAPGRKATRRDKGARMESGDEVGYSPATSDLNGIGRAKKEFIGGRMEGPIPGAVVVEFASGEGKSLDESHYLAGRIRVRR